MNELKMRILRLTKKRLIALLTLPAVFIITIVILSRSLSNSGDQERDRGQRLVSSRRNEGDSIKTRAWKLLHTDDPLDFKYDENRLLTLGQIETQADEEARNKGNLDHSFNELISSRLSLNRIIPDARDKLCLDKKYRKDLAKASVIICFYNEAWSTLLRTVHSVINRTPPHLLYEIVLVDDASDMAHLQTKLAEYVWMIHPNITLVRTVRREGLIRARMYGARVATGEVLVFLDSHCEVNVQWLEPLLDHIADNSRAVAIPIIDIIQPTTFEYTPAALVKGGFTWGMHFKWDPMPVELVHDPKLRADPIETPTMAGGLFAIKRQYFYDMGNYDKDLDTWGGENLEMSFRIWLCGGRLDMIPCSRVGHIFRTRRPYNAISGYDSMIRNSIRVARVWLDEYIEHFFQAQPAAKVIKYGNITDRLELKKKLDCKPFSWYLKFIYPDQALPGESKKKQQSVQRYETNFIRKGKIVHLESGQCLKAHQEGVPLRFAKLMLAKCSDEESDYQIWKESDSNELVLYKNLCLNVIENAKSRAYAKLDKCHGARGSQAWIWKIQNVVYQLYNPTTGKCLVPITEDGTTYLTLEICSSNKNSAFKLVEDKS